MCQYRDTVFSSSAECSKLSLLTVCLSSFHDHKDDIRKRLSYTTHKLEMVETEFDSTRQYLETELRRAQEELEKFTDKLRRYTLEKIRHFQILYSTKRLFY